MKCIKMDMQYLTQEHLQGFETYKYSALDTSPLSIYVMHPFWNRVVEFCPKWIAPNVLTFAGFLFTVFNFILFSYYDYEFYASSDDHPEVAPIPRWLWAAAAINIFLAYTLDGIDGKQARRTQTSGPLGELFDHGLDSWSAVLIPTCMYSIFGRTTYSISTLRMYYCLWNVFVNFHLSHWEKYNTGVLFLPWGYDASMLVAIVIFMITSIFGHELWNFNLPYNISAGQTFEVTFYISALVSNFPVCLWNVYKSYRDGTGKMRPFTEAVRPLVPVLYFLTLCTLWVLKSPGDIINTDPRSVYLVTGTIFSNICCRLIVAQMSSTRCEIFNWLLLPASAVVALTLVLPVPLNVELGLVYSLTVLATCAHIHYGTCVVRQMCRHFRINCFQIKQHSQ
ncbi:ethanolaminephosphotransferase 1-like [Schistocerca nitens]|uniref:ethanolaminephosphotransferase 1-like n=1 Tax=Schistocerca nitens TaxID=7011 RepID=UPI002118A496|nr:ethanolaminephosphotransferase 1-like [Schistocerca nitens]